MPQPAATIQRAARRGRVTGELRGHTFAQWYCLAVAVLLGARGATTLLFGAGFGLPGTGWRGIQQVTFAAILIGAWGSRKRAYLVLAPFGVAYLVIWIAGVINGHEAFGIVPIDSRDKILYITYAIVAAILLALPSQRPTTQEH